MGMPYETFRTAMRRLTRARVVTIQRLGNSYTYALSSQFLDRCRTLYEIRFDLDAIASYAASGGEVEPPTVVKLNQRGGEVEPPPYRAQEEHYRSATANAGRSDERPEEGHLVSDFDPSFYEAPTKRTTRWGGEAEGTPLGGEDKVVIGKVVKRSPPRSKDVLAVKEYFQTKLLAFSEARHVPLWESVGKMHNNIKYLVDTQGHSQDILERAIEFFASQAPSMMFQGTSLWDQFFAHREEALKFAAVAGIGSRGGPRESQDDLAKRLSQHQQQTRST
jgi:hypothetical protein